MFKKKKVKKPRKEFFLVRILNKVLKLDYLKMLDISVGFVKGFSVKLEFFEKKEPKNDS